MQKSMFLCLVVCLAAFGTAYADPPKDNCGCGWGTLAFEGESGLAYQVMAATTNGSFGNQTFGITFGTAGCEETKNFTSNEPLNRFVADNMDNLAKDIAMGEGEYLTTLAALMEVTFNERDEFYRLLQDNFSDVFPSESISHADVIDNIARITQRG